MIKRILPYLVLLTLGLWLGGLVTLILFVSTLFAKARAVAIDAAPVLFNVFERYQLVLAAVALAALVAWRSAGRSRHKTLAITAALAATALAVLQIAAITPRIVRYQNTDRPAFDHYHHLASTNYTVLSVFVLLALVMAITAARRELLLELATDGGA